MDDAGDDVLDGTRDEIEDFEELSFETGERIVGTNGIF